MKGFLKKSLLSLCLCLLVLLPFFSWISAGPLPYLSPEGLFEILPPEGWTSDDSGHMGPGIIMKGPAGESGTQPVFHLVYQPAGIVTLDVQWLTRLGQIRYDFQRVRFLSMKNYEEAVPPYSEALYTYLEKDLSYKAKARLVKEGDTFFFMTAVAAEEEFGEVEPLFSAILESFRTGKGD